MTEALSSNLDQWLSPAFRLFFTNLAILLYYAILPNFLMMDVIRMSFVHIKLSCQFNNSS